MMLSLKLWRLRALLILWVDTGIPSAVAFTASGGLLIPRPRRAV